jgi:chromosome segregation ATPase
MPEEMKPLSPEEVDAIEKTKHYYPTGEQWLATVRERERERDELELLRKDLIASLNCSGDFIVRVIATLKQERDELQRQLADSAALAFSNQQELDQCRADRMDLDGENQELRRKLDGLQRQLADSNLVCAVAKEQLAEARKDTERVEAWEAMNKRGIRPVLHFDSDSGKPIGWGWQNEIYPTWREAIDAARIAG